MNKNIHDLKTLSDAFIDFETQHRVLKQQISDVYFWRLIRFDLFLKIAMAYKFLDFAHPKLKQKQSKLRKFFLMSKDVFLYHAWRIRTPYKILVVPHSRRINNKDIYSYELIEKIEQSDLLFLDKDTKKPCLRMAFYEMLCSLSNALYNRLGFSCVRFSPNDKRTISTLQNALNQHFSTHIDLNALIYREYFRFKLYYPAYKRILRRLKIKTILMVVHYGHMPLIAAAKDLNIHVTEIQHGTISNIHMGYFFPHEDQPPYTPDTLLCHGDFWTKKPPLPETIETIVVGAPHISQLQSTAQKNRKQILFFSQGTIAKELFEFAYTVAQKIPDHRIIYRLHPSEIADDYDKKIGKKKPSLANFEITYKSDSFFTDLIESEYIAAAYSTTLYEAMALGAKAIVIGLNGYTAVQDIIDNGDAVLANSPDEFVSALQKAKICPDKEKYYKPFDKDKDIFV